MRITAAVIEERSGSFDLPHRSAARDGYFPMPYPGVYGHEGAGIVAAVGNVIEHLAVGGGFPVDRRLTF